MKFQWNPWAAENWSVPESEWNDPTLPMITLGVLNYNRCTELRQTLDVLTRAVQYPHYEIIVVDNGSTDGSLEMVRTEFPTVIVHEIGLNRGVSSRNVMPQIGRGKYLFSFDDDSYPGSPAMVLRIVQYMEVHDDFDAVSGSCYQPLSGIMETEGWERFGWWQDLNRGFKGIYVVEGGICFRRKSLLVIEGYDRSWGYGCEGMDLGLQLLERNFTTYFSPWFLTLHLFSPTMRPPGRRAYANSRQMIWLVAKHWPAFVAYPILGLVILRRLLALAMHPETAKQNIKGLKDGFRGIQPFLQHQPKLSVRQTISLARFYLFLFRWA